MKKSILNLGTILNKKDQKEVNGGLYWCAGGNAHTTNRWCPVRCFMGNCLL